MKALVVTDFGSPPEIAEIDVPACGPDEVLVRVEASGLCHSDLHIAGGDWPVKPELPLILGHEGVGVVEDCGAQVDRALLGRRVMVPWVGSTCETCDACLSGNENRCTTAEPTGFVRPGTHAQYARAKARFAQPVPDGLDPVESAPLACAGVTSYHAVVVAGAVRPGELVAVFGVGGLGHLAIQYARLAGGRVAAVDIRSDKLELAGELGADVLVDAAQQDPAEVLQRMGGAHVAVVVAASAVAYRQALAALAPGGRLVLVALPRDDRLELSLFDTVARSITVVGSSVGTRTDLRDVLRLHATGRTRVLVESRPLTTAVAAMDELAGGQVAARLVLVPERVV